MPRTKVRTTGRFATRAELEAEIGRMGDAGAFDSEIARATGVSSSVVAQYLRTRQKRRKTHAAPPAPTEILPPAPKMDLPLVASGREILTATGRCIASAETVELAAEIAGAMNLLHPSCADKLVRDAARELMLALSRMAPAKAAPSGTAPARRPVGRPRKVASAP